MKKQTPVPTENEVRRFFQEAYYSTIEYDSETTQTKVRYNDLTGCIYPLENDDVD